MRKARKKKRQKMLKNLIEKDPFLTDEELAEKFEVSIQTIRLDRMELSIPEMRERTKNLAQNAYQRLTSVTEGEVIGELIDLELNKYAESYLRASEEMALKKTPIIRGHHIFAQANSLAVAAIDAEIVLTGSSEVKFQKIAKVGETLKAKAYVKKNKKNKFYIDVNTYSDGEEIFASSFVMFAKKKEEIQK